MTLSSNRQPTTSAILLIGLTAGLLSYAAAEALTPSSIRSSGEHDILLAQRLGFILSSACGAWLGWLQRSWARTAGGAAAGILIGLVYSQLSARGNFLAIMVAFPCLLGGVLAALCPSNRSRWFIDLPTRLGKGMLAGLLLGLGYMIILSLLYPWFWPQSGGASGAAGHVHAMWRAGPIALAIPAATFFVLMRWAVGLVRFRVVLEPAEP